MSLSYDAFLTRIIDDGIAAAEKDYALDQNKREGSVAGFEVCRGKTPEQLAAILRNASARTTEAAVTARENGGWMENYWRIRCFEIEIEWVANVVSAMLQNEGKPVIVPPTCRGVMKVAEILEVKGQT